MKDSPAQRLIVIGGSAGSVRLLSDLLAKLKPDLQAPICVALHRSAEAKSKLAYVLQAYANLHVLEPQEETMRPGHLYLAPADHHLLVEGTTVKSDVSGLVHYSRPSIDVLLLSAAESYGAMLTAILVTGANQDGANGMAYVKQLGGTTIVQDPEDASIDFMPKAALAVMEPDHILDRQGIADYLNNEF